MRKLFFILFCLLSLASISQISGVYTRQLSTFKSSTFISAPDGDYIGVLKGEVPEDKKNKSWNDYRKAISFIKYDKNMKLMREVKLSSSSGMCSGYYSELKKIGSKYWFIYLEPGPDYNIGNIKAVEVDPLTFLQKEAKTIIAGTTIDQTISRNEIGNLRFMSGVSPKGNYSFIYIQVSENEFFLTSFDENLNAKWGRKEKMMRDLKRGGTCSIAIDDYGYLYMGEQHKKGSLFFSVYSPSGQANRYEVALESGIPNEIVFHPAENNDEVFVSGTYMKTEYTLGIYTGLVSKKGVLSKIVKTEFPKHIIESLEKDDFGSMKEKKYGLHGSVIVKPVIYANGGRGIIVEPYYVTPSPTMQQMVTGSLIYVNLTAEPIFAIIKKYGRGARTTDYEFNSMHKNGSLYYAYQYDSKMIIFYSDNPENLTRDLTQSSKTVNPLNEELAVAVVDKDGSVKKQLAKPEKFSSLTANGMEVPAGTVLIPVPFDVSKSSPTGLIVAVKL